MNKVALTTQQYVDYLKCVAAKIAAEKDYITELDAATGDGDHWANMNTGFTKLVEIEAQLRTCSFADLFKKVAMTIMSGVGGSSGILYASAYLKASSVVAEREVLDAQGLLDVLDAQLQGIMQRGNSKPGFKTMIDPLYQAVEAMRSTIAEGEVQAVETMRQGAKQGMEATRDMEAVRGRACYQANKGVGHLDPGAVTMYYQLDLLGQAALNSVGKQEA